jgi:hypothetical protein
VKGETHGDFYLLIRRNKSLLEYLWPKNSTSSNTTGFIPYNNIDIILFHETNLAIDKMEYIQAQTPKLKMTFISIKFTGYAKYDNSTGKKIIINFIYLLYFIINIVIY